MVSTGGFAGGEGATESDIIETLDIHQQALKENSCLFLYMGKQWPRQLINVRLSLCTGHEVSTVKGTNNAMTK